MSEFAFRRESVAGCVLIPWVMFVITGALTAIGAVGGGAIVAPIALSFAARHGISPLLMGAMVVHGAQAGGFSPISIYGSIVNGILERENLPGNEIALFLASLAADLLIAGVVFVLFGGLKPARHLTAESDEPPGPSAEEASARLDAPRAATLLSLLVLVVAVLVLDLDAGLTAITLAVLISAVWPDTSRKAVGAIAWPTVLLICGVLTYVGVLEEMGTITWAGEGVGGIGVPLLAALLLCYTGAIVSAFASPVGIMGALIPLAVPVPHPRRDRGRRNDRGAGGVGDRGGRQPLLDQRCARPRRGAGCRPGTLPQAADGVRRGRRRRGAGRGRARPGGARIRVTPAGHRPRLSILPVHRLEYDA